MSFNRRVGTAGLLGCFRYSTLDTRNAAYLAGNVSKQFADSTQVEFKLPYYYLEIARTF